MRILATIVAALCLAGCGTIGPLSDPAYKGADAGTLVFGAGKTQDRARFLDQSFDFRLWYREVNSDGTRSSVVGSITPPGDPPSDFPESDPESGQVRIQHLKPGNYEVFWYSISWDDAVYHVRESSDRHEFSLPFTIKPGEALYIGDFNGVEKASPNLFGTLVTTGGFVVISDKQQRDLDIARRRDPTLSSISVEVLDPILARQRDIRPAP